MASGSCKAARNSSDCSLAGPAERRPFPSISPRPCIPGTSNKETRAPPHDFLRTFKESLQDRLPQLYGEPAPHWSLNLDTIFSCVSSPSPSTLIEPIRHASHVLVREIGFLHPRLANTYSPSAVHALIELGNSLAAATATSLCAVLNLDKSTAASCGC